VHRHRTHGQWQVVLRQISAAPQHCLPSDILTAGYSAASARRRPSPTWDRSRRREDKESIFTRGYQNLKTTVASRAFILDDFLNDVYSKQVCDLFTKGSHHRDINVILIAQNLFQQELYYRDISLNATYLVLLKNVRDKHQFAYLARQVYPEDSDSLYRAYLDATTARLSGLRFCARYWRPSQVSNQHLSGRRSTRNLFGGRLTMRRIRSNYHALQMLLKAQPKLRKAIILNARKELLNSISECALNVLRGNMQLSACQKRKLRKHKTNSQGHCYMCRSRRRDAP
jgi:hypothetical protein